MRCRVLVLATLVACAPPFAGGKCEPVSASWAAPVYRCGAGGGSSATPVLPNPEDTGATNKGPDADTGTNTKATAVETAAQSKVTMSGDAVTLQDNVEFAGDDTVADGSTPILDDLGALMADHPEITRLDVTVHAKTKKGAEKRAAMIKKYLIEHKTEAQRINAKGDKGKDSLEIKVGKRNKKK